MIQAVANQADELAGELGGVTNELLGGNALGGGSIFRAQGARRIQFGFVQTGVFQSREQKSEQIVGECGEVRLDQASNLAIGPSFLEMKAIFGDVIGFLDFPTQKIQEGNQAGA